jgi:phosphohistidine phosphatase SixA
MPLYKTLVLTFIFVTFASKSSSGPDDIIQTLKQGGYVIYLRHAATDHSQADSDLSNFENCNTQRNLSSQGETEAVTFGVAIKRANIKISSVISSPYCRCVDTSTKAFSKVVVNPLLRATFNENKQNTDELLGYLDKKLSEVPDKGTNSVLVSHSANLREVTGIWPKPEGVMHVFKPDGKSYQHIGSVTPKQWQQYLGIINTEQN